MAGEEPDWTKLWEEALPELVAKWQKILAQEPTPAEQWRRLIAERRQWARVEAQGVRVLMENPSLMEYVRRTPVVEGVVLN